MKEPLQFLLQFTKQVGWQGPVLISISVVFLTYKRQLSGADKTDVVVSAIDWMSLFFLFAGVLLIVLKVVDGYFSQRDYRAMLTGLSAGIIGGSAGAALGYAYPEYFYDGYATIEHAPRLLRFAICLVYAIPLGPFISFFAERARQNIDSEESGSFTTFFVLCAIVSIAVTAIVAFTVPEIGDPGIKYGQIFILFLAFSIATISLALIQRSFSLVRLIGRLAVFLGPSFFFYFVLESIMVAYWYELGKFIPLSESVMNAWASEADAPTYFLGITDAEMNARLTTIAFLFVLTLYSTSLIALSCSNSRIMIIVDKVSEKVLRSGLKR